MVSGTSASVVATDIATQRHYKIVLSLEVLAEREVGLAALLD
jgi:hypothetical protein